MDVLQRMGPPRASGSGPAGALVRTGPATSDEAAAMRRSFRSWLSRVADPDTVDDVTLAVYEALANVVDHAYGASSTPGEMRLWAAVSPPLAAGRDLVVTVSDDGAWRRAGNPGWRGRGLSLMHTLTHASVICGQAGTTVQLRRRVAPAAQLVPA